MVISAKEIPYLLGRKISQLSFFHLSSEQWRSVVFQIDVKDQQGRYIITSEDRYASEIKKTLSANDELVFRKKDLGDRLDHASEQFRQYSLLEIELTLAGSSSRWIYINLRPPESDFLSSSEIVYDQERDIVTSAVYKSGFSPTVPFLLDSFNWKLPHQSGWSPDLSDTMKIRHNGKFFGLPFKRTHDDYRSRLVAIKKGPLRIIRRTENRVKVFWKLRTPALYIDYVMMPDGFVMDTIIDIPFKIALFFSNLETLTTMDWNHGPDLPALTIHATPGTSADALSLPVNGRQSADKKAFNRIMANKFSVSSDMGVFDVTLDIPENFPIQSNLYLYDALHEMDPPENNPGQFGNVGFRTTGWENIDSKLHHLKFTVCMTASQ
ncbi:MAG: hypothetical protein QNL62_05040 [Gammaproteobacteria bacterium]|nr:hypothetical protein [Gammaproteobacteria bacterium]